MSKETREHLSSLMDGEIKRDAGRFLVRRLSADAELQGTWARYHLVRDCLRHSEGWLASEDLCGKVQQALADEAPQRGHRHFATTWLKPAAGMAIAASVALMAINTIGPSPEHAQTAAQLAGQQQLESFNSPNAYNARPKLRQVSLSGGSGNENQRMSSYLLRHYQVTGSTGGKGFVSFVPIIVTRSAGSEEGSDRETGTDDQTRDDKSANRR